MADKKKTEEIQDDADETVDAVDAAEAVDAADAAEVDAEALDATAGAGSATEEPAEDSAEEDAPLDPTSDEAGLPGDEISVSSGVRAAESRGQHRRKIRVGVVVKNALDKTVNVEVQRQFAHPLYGKQVGRSKKYHAHDENNEYQRGDVVQIVETRPLSKTKRWRVDQLVERPE